jgi:hypothetical protein
MSLGKTLLKVAIGVAIVKGVSTLAKGGLGGGASSGTAGRGTPYGKGAPGGLDDILKDALGTGTGSRGQAETGGGFGGQSGGMGDLLDQITGGASPGRSGTARSGTNSRGSAAEDGRVFTPTPRPPSPKSRTETTQGDDSLFTPTPRPPRRNAPKGGLEDMLSGGTAGQGGGDLLDAVLGGKGAITLQEPKARQEELAAALALRAMLQAVKCDGELDEAEKRKLTQQLGDATREEVAFVTAELQRPVDLDGLARQVPNGMEEQVYAVSLMAIDLDNQREAKYLAGLAQALDLTAEDVNRLHDRLRAPRLFR